MSGPAPGVCLTFDDLFVENWCAALPLFAEFDAKVTFCISHLHEASAAQIDGLHRLQEVGHEIGFHTRTHPKLGPYLNRHGVAEWLADEVDRGVAEHRAAGFAATSFAAPFHATTPESRAGLGQRFAIVRAGGFRGAARDLSARIYRRPGPDRAVDNIGSVDFQHPAQGGWAHLDIQLDAIAAAGGVGVFTGHDIRARKDGRGFYSSQRQMRRLLNAVASRGLAFHTLSGFAAVAV